MEWITDCSAKAVKKYRMKKIYDDKKPIDMNKGFYVLSMEIFDRKKRAHELRYIEDYNIEYIGWETKEIFVKKYRNNCGKFWIYKMHVVPVWDWRDCTINVYKPRMDVNFFHLHTVYFPPKPNVVILEKDDSA